LNEAASPQKATLRPGPLILTGFFIFLYAFALALAPAVRLHTASFTLEWSYLTPFLGWLAGHLLLWFVNQKTSAFS